MPRDLTTRWTDLIYLIEDSRIVEFSDWTALSSGPAGRFRALRDV
jgi:hypothetical protein